PRYFIPEKIDWKSILPLPERATHTNSSRSEAHASRHIRRNLSGRVRSGVCEEGASRAGMAEKTGVHRIRNHAVQDPIDRLWVGKKTLRAMSYPGPGRMYRHCIWCGRPFRFWRWELSRNRGKFCSQRCYLAARRAFTKALADGRLELILAEERERAKKPV